MPKKKKKQQQQQQNDKTFSNFWRNYLQKIFSFTTRILVMARQCVNGTVLRSQMLPKWMFPDSISPTKMKKSSKGSVEHISGVFCDSLTYCVLKGLLKRCLQDIDVTRSFGFNIWEKRELWGSSFFSNCSKLNVDLRNMNKKWTKCFRFCR